MDSKSRLAMSALRVAVVAAAVVAVVVIRSGETPGDPVTVESGYWPDADAVRDGASSDTATRAQTASDSETPAAEMGGEHADDEPAAAARLDETTSPDSSDEPRAPSEAHADVRTQSPLHGAASRWAASLELIEPLLARVEQAIAEARARDDEVALARLQRVRAQLETRRENLEEALEARAVRP